MLSIGIGSKTSTGGVVIEGNAGLIFDGLVASSVVHKATCPSCKKGVGEIVAVGSRTAYLPAGPAARAGDYIACGCPPGANVLVAQGTVSIDASQGSSAYLHLRNTSSDAVGKELSALAPLDHEMSTAAFGNNLCGNGVGLSIGSVSETDDATDSSQLFDPTDENYHYYDFESEICEVDSVCNIESVASANRMHPAPGMFSNTLEVVNGQVSQAQIGYASELDDFGPVVHSVSSDGRTVINTTLEDHVLFPGYLKRHVFQKGNKIYIRTVGEGTGPMGTANEIFQSPCGEAL